MDPPATTGEAASTMTARSPSRAGPFSVPVSRGAVHRPRGCSPAVAVAAIVADAAQRASATSSSRSGRSSRKRRAPPLHAQARNAELANELREAQAKVALLEARVSESQTQQASLEALYRELAPSRDEVALNEVEQVLLLASQQLAIANNVQAALARAAARRSEARARFDRPQLVPLRRALGARHRQAEGGSLRRRRGHLAQARPGRSARSPRCRSRATSACRKRPVVCAAPRRGGVVALRCARRGARSSRSCASRSPIARPRRSCRRRRSTTCARTCGCGS